MIYHVLVHLTSNWLLFWYRPLLLHDEIIIIQWHDEARVHLPLHQWQPHQLGCPSCVKQPVDASQGSWMVLAHIVHELLPSLLVDFNDRIYVNHWQLLMLRVLRIYLFNAWVNLDLFIMNVLLNAPHIVVSPVKVISACKSLVLGRLLLDVVFSLLHVHKHLFQILSLLFLLIDKFARLNAFSNLKHRQREWFHLEVNHRAAHLNCFGLGGAKLEPFTHKNQSSKLRHVVLKIESIILEANNCMLSRDTDVIDAKIRVMSTTKPNRFSVQCRSDHVHHPASVLFKSQAFEDHVISSASIIKDLSRPLTWRDRDLNEVILLAGSFEDIWVRGFANLTLKLPKVVTAQMGVLF